MRVSSMFVLFLTLALSGCAWFGGETAEPSPAVQAESSAVGVDSQAGKGTAVQEKQSSQKAKASTKRKAGAKSEDTIRAELDSVGRKLVRQASRTVMPSKSSKQVKKVNKEYVASYVEIDTDDVSTEMRPGSAGQYVGVVRYLERMYECRGKSKKAALSATCEQIRSRGVRELIRYDGKAWQY